MAATAEQIAALRLLCNDQDAGTPVFSDSDYDAFLTLEGSNLKRAAAQALDTIADDEALTSKVIRDHDLTTDGAKVADSLRKRAAALRAQADRDERDEDEADEAAGFFAVVPVYRHPNHPELTEHPPW